MELGLHLNDLTAHNPPDGAVGSTQVVPPDMQKALNTFNPWLQHPTSQTLCGGVLQPRARNVRTYIPRRNIGQA